MVSGIVLGPGEIMTVLSTIGTVLGTALSALMAVYALGSSAATALGDGTIYEKARTYGRNAIILLGSAISLKGISFAGKLLGNEGILKNLFSQLGKISFEIIQKSPQFLRILVLEDVPQAAALLKERMAAEAMAQFEKIAAKCSPARLRELTETLWKAGDKLEDTLGADDILEAEKQLDNLDDVDDAAKAVAQAAEARGKAAALLIQLKDKMAADAFEYLTADKELLGDEKAIDSVVSVINKVYDKIDGSLDLDDVKYIAKKAKKAEREEDILKYVCRKHGVTGIGGGSEFIHLSNNNIRHIRKHSFEEMKKQAAYVDDITLKEMLENNTFFNKNWSQEQIINNVEIAYNKLLRQGKTGMIPYEIDGETIYLFIKEDGMFETAYGTYVYTVQDFR